MNKRDRNITSLLLCGAILAICVLSGCKTPEQLIESGRIKLKATDKGKAEKAFTRALAKDPLSAPAMFGLGEVAFAKGDIETAIKRTEEGLTLAPKSYEEHFNLMRWYCIKRDSANALDQMRTLYWDSAYRHRIWQSDTTKEIALVKGTGAYRRWHSGMRRLKIQPLDAFTNETDKGTENDQFVTVVSEGRVILATRTVQNRNQAYWRTDFVVFDTYMDSAIVVTQLDEDYVFCDVLSSRTLDPRSTGEITIGATNSQLRLRVSDTDECVHTSGTALPTTPSLATTLKSIQALRVVSNPSELDKSKVLK